MSNITKIDSREVPDKTASVCGDAENPLSLAEELKHLRHHRDFSVGLWCIDQDPKTVSMEWILANAFQLTYTENSNSNP